MSDPYRSPDRHNEPLDDLIEIRGELYERLPETALDETGEDSILVVAGLVLVAERLLELRVALDNSGPRP